MVIMSQDAIPNPDVFSPILECFRKKYTPSGRPKPPDSEYSLTTFKNNYTGPLP